MVLNKISKLVAIAGTLARLVGSKLTIEPGSSPMIDRTKSEALYFIFANAAARPAREIAIIRHAMKNDATIRSFRVSRCSTDVAKTLNSG